MGNALFHIGMRNIHGDMARHQSVPQARQHIGYRITELHLALLLPARLGHAGQFAQERQLTETNSAESKLSHVTARASTAEAAMMLLHLELRGPLRLDNHRLLGHESSCPAARDG
jgi:hypothetical protein